MSSTTREVSRLPNSSTATVPPYVSTSEDTKAFIATPRVKKRDCPTLPPLPPTPYLVSRPILSPGDPHVTSSRSLTSRPGSQASILTQMVARTLYDLDRRSGPPTPGGQRGRPRPETGRSLDSMSVDGRLSREVARAATEDSKLRLLEQYVDPSRRQHLSVSQVATARLLARRLLHSGSLETPTRARRVIIAD